MSNTGYRPLSQLPRLDPSSGGVTVVIETPKGSANKYDYDESSGAFRLAAVLPEGSTFPYDFGFIPSTLGEDGDPLDVLVLLDAPAVVGCVLTVRLIGVIQAEQRTKGGDWCRNDRLLAVATHAHTHEHIQTIDDLRPRLLDQIEAIFPSLQRDERKGVQAAGTRRSKAGSRACGRGRGGISEEAGQRRPRRGVMPHVR